MPYAFDFAGHGAFTPDGRLPDGTDIAAHNAAVEAAELAHIATSPEEIIAYVGAKLGDGMGCDRHGPTSRRALTNWLGTKIGTCYLSSSWPVRTRIGSRMYQIWATVNGVAYTGRGFGEGMIVRLRRARNA